MVGLQAQRRFKIGLPIGEDSPGAAKIRSSETSMLKLRMILTALADVGGLMIAFQQAKFFGVEGLGAEADAGDAVVGEDGDGFGIDVGRVGFDAEFGFAAGSMTSQRVPIENGLEQALEVGRRASGWACRRRRRACRLRAAGRAS